MPKTRHPVFASMDGAACKVEMTTAQADLISRAMAFFVDKAVGLSEEELEEAAAIRDMAAEIDPEVINGWAL